MKPLSPKPLGKENIEAARVWFREVVEEGNKDNKSLEWRDWKAFYDLAANDPERLLYCNVSYVMLNMTSGQLSIFPYNTGGSQQVLLMCIPSKREQRGGDKVPPLLQQWHGRTVPVLKRDEEASQIARTNQTLLNAQALVTAMIHYIACYTSTTRQAVSTWERVAEFIQDKNGNRLYLGNKGRYPAIPFPIGISRELVSFAYSIYSLYKA